MANPEHLDLLKQGVEAWNKWRQSNPELEPDLSEADLHRAILPKADLNRALLNRALLMRTNLIRTHLMRANLDGADLSAANLSGANLSGADLGGAILSGANLGGADLNAADLSGADLSDANLSGAGLNGANLSKVNLSETILIETNFANVNLADAKGLDTCRYKGPSILDFRTLQRSGPLPLVFLRGCGLPDLLIDYFPSLLNQPIQYYSCFISYSSKDEDFARRLYADLQDKGVRCWFAPHNIQGGRKIYEQIGEAIRLHEKLLLVLSEHSMNSEWVKTEIAEARQREVCEKRQVLFPISLVDYETIKQWKCFDANTGKDSAREIREYFIPDFSNWKSHDDYQKSCGRLLRDLKPALERKPENYNR